MVIAAPLAMWKSRTRVMVSGWIRGTSPDSTNTVSKLCKAYRASIMACPVPRCSRWSTKLIPPQNVFALCLEANDGEDVLRRYDLARRRHNMRQQRLPGNFVQHLGTPGFQPCAFAGCQNRDRELPWFALCGFGGGSQLWHSGLRFAANVTIPGAAR